MFFWIHNIPNFLDLPQSEILQIIGCFLVSLFGLFLMKSFIYREKEPGIHVSIAIFVQSLAFGALASLILFGGIAGTFAAVEALFDVDFSSDIYGYLAVICSAFLFGSFALNYYTFSIKQFLDHWTPTSEIQLSRMNKIFGLYIFLPISLLYLAIFLAYGLKILFTGVWPKGVLVWMGLGYVVGVVFTYYLTYFHQSSSVEKLRKVLFASFFVIGGLMSGAITLRVLQYGITLDRYLVMMVILFVFSSAVGVLIWKKKRILILISLLTLLSAISFF